MRVVSRAFRSRPRTPENYTLDAVVTDDAAAAVSVLADTDEVDAGTVFVAGHGQGGMCAPRIARRHGGVAGVVALDPPADPLTVASGDPVDEDAIDDELYDIDD